MRTLAFIRRWSLRALPLAACACASAAPAPPPGYRFLECGEPPDQGVAVAVVDPDGDVLSVRGHAFRLGRGAVIERKRFKMHDRRTRNVGVDIRPHGYRFTTAPGDSTTVTISYARCGDLPVDYRPAIVEVRPGTTIPVGEPLPSTVNREARTVTARIEHLSGYLIAGT
ncbi:MAG TPA: hypothetical protein VF142_09880 [Longimicrobium sp.]